MSPMRATKRIFFPGLVALASALAQSFHIASPLVEEFRLIPGEVASSQVVLVNNTNAPLVVRLSQGDYRLRPEGPEFLPPGTHPRSNASWVTLSQAEVALPPGGQVAVSYQIRIPQDNKLSGTYFSVIFAGAAEPEPQAPGEAPVGIAIAQRLRYAVQVLVNIGNTGEPKIAFPKARLVTGEKEATLEVEVGNSGDRYIRPMVRLELFREDGSAVTSLQEGPVTLPPDSAILLRLSLPKLAPGTYQAALVLDGGGAFIFGKRYRFSLKE
jgi:hypothetical protein